MTLLLPQRVGTRLRRPKMVRPSTVPLRLFAPTVEAVSVVGSWALEHETPLERQPDGTWQVALPLADGRYHYRFRTRSRSWFRAGEDIEFVDPCAREIAVREDGEWGVLTIRGGYPVVDAYRWRHEQVRLPRDRGLVVYEMHVGDFSGGPGDRRRRRGGKAGKASAARGRFADVRAKLRYLIDLGINAIEVMPVAAGPGGYSWGYTPRHFFAPAPGYGTPTDLKRLVDTCHAHGIRVIADMVCNHADVSTPLAQIDHDYWFHHTPPEGQLAFGPKFNVDWRDPATGVMPARKFLNEMLLYWVNEYHLDGIRFDATALIDNFDFLGWIGERLKEETDGKPFLLIAEHLPHDPAIVGPGGPMDSAWHDTFYFALTATLRGRAFEGCEPFDPSLVLAALEPRREGYWGPRAAINYLENHDHERALTELARAGIDGHEALRREELGATLLLTAVGIPMLYHGQEFGMTAAKTLEESKLDWTLLRQQPNRRLRERYCALIALRKEWPALQSGEFECLRLDAERRMIAFRRWATPQRGGGEIIVVANCGDADVIGWEVPTWPAHGIWQEVFGDGVIAADAGAGPVRAGPVGAGPVRVDVARWSARIFRHAGLAMDV